ncbi:hypothetical protein M4C71_12520 [Klebsiella pneumoniae]|nr:hypothetical protein [Klebsiella pneumoniae]STT29219.1 Uncharacterised protein [Klebsiella pneumoniae]
MSQQYTNELTTDVLERLRQPPFTDEFLSELEPQSRQSLVAEMESMLQRPVLHIFRGATIGSLTRHGGVIRETSGKSTLTGIILRGSEIKLCIRMDVRRPLFAEPVKVG